MHGKTSLIIFIVLILFEFFWFLKKVKGTQGGQNVVARSAAPAAGCPAGENGCKSETKDGVTGTVCCCNSDLCNGATTFRQQSLVGYLVVGIIATIYYRFF